MDEIKEMEEVPDTIPEEQGFIEEVEEMVPEPPVLMRQKMRLRRHSGKYGCEYVSIHTSARLARRTSQWINPKARKR